jgi:hypothetical protein
MSVTGPSNPSDTPQPISVSTGEIKGMTQQMQEVNTKMKHHVFKQNAFAFLLELLQDAQKLKTHTMQIQGEQAQHITNIQDKLNTRLSQMGDMTQIEGQKKSQKGVESNKNQADIDVSKMKENQIGAAQEQIKGNFELLQASSSAVMTDVQTSGTGATQEKQQFTKTLKIEEQGSDIMSRDIQGKK